MYFSSQDPVSFMHTYLEKDNEILMSEVVNDRATWHICPPKLNK